ncbi:DUF2946 family protein [uncultured Ramlibacter sp.]|uniref:DUF2946 family protein n=1 Tax=uncultured Ramlibacter sp. TaxID=260755 RepID=UPI00261309E5|nr:DUF2946 family protein [uncultured Ramlibacter sp.]
MQALRNASFLARLVLAWFALSIGVALASPLVQPQSMELICSGAGAMKLLLKDADGGQSQPSPTLDCPLCASVAPAPVAAAMPAAQPLGLALQSLPAAHIAARTAVPPPGRGPPLFAIT